MADDVTVRDGVCAGMNGRVLRQVGAELVLEISVFGRKTEITVRSDEIEGPVVPEEAFDKRVAISLDDRCFQWWLVRRETAAPQDPAMEWAEFAEWRQAPVNDAHALRARLPGVADAELSTWLDEVLPRHARAIRSSPRFAPLATSPPAAPRG